MTSEERKEARYQRRVAKWIKKKKEFLQQSMPSTQGAIKKKPFVIQSPVVSPKTKKNKIWNYFLLFINFKS